MKAPDRGTTLLAVGAGLGIVLAASGLLAPGGLGAHGLPPDAVARVNGEVVRLDEYRRALETVARDRRAPVGAGERRHVLDRLVDEELLVQRGLELGLARGDARVRRDLVAGVVDAVVAHAGDLPPSKADVEAFYRQNRALFVRPGRLHVRQVWCRAGSPAEDAGALERARRAVVRLRAGEEFATVRETEGDRELSPPPDGPLPVAKLADYLGPTVLAAALALDVGAIADPVRSATGYHVVQVVGREAEEVAPLAEIHGQVEEEMRRRAGDDALRAELEALRAGATIELASPPP
jgi:hypothetical protein